MTLYEQHKKILDDAVKALHERTFFAQYPEFPSPKIYGERADDEGREKFKSLLGNKYEALRQSGPSDWKGEELSPYTQKKLDIRYPVFGVEELIKKSKDAFHQWRKLEVEARAGILIETLERLKNRFFEIAYATMHTTGQGYMMAFQASGPHAADRALEAIAAGFEEMKRFPRNAHWKKPMGKYELHVEKEWEAVPKGIGLVIGCSTFPTWNSVPGLYASLVTGNTVIAKPHPLAILPMAIFLTEIQEVLADNGMDPNICQLAVDTPSEQITEALAEHPNVKLIDYTGNAAFGSYLENLGGKAVFTEKTGVNSVILDSADDLGQVLANLAFSVCLYSGQMCTAPQNFFIPKDGVKTSDGVVKFEEVAQKFVDAINEIVENPKVGPFVLGTIQNEKTCSRIKDAANIGNKIWLESREVENPMFKKARTATPMVIEASANERSVFNRELFGPIVLLIRTENTDQSLKLASELAEKHGAISCAAYTTERQMREKIREEIALAATPVSFNLVGNIYINQNASFSDFHVTGGNPAGNASFTNPEYVVKRFTWVGFREPAPA